MTRGPCLTWHTSRPEARRRRIVAQGACNRPAVIRPSIFAATSGQEGEPPHKERANRPAVIRPSIFAATSGQGGEPPHKERATALRLCAPSASTGGPTSGMGAQAHMSCTQRAGFWVQKSHTAARANTAPPRDRRRRLRR
jgi:hypothetical protein